MTVLDVAQVGLFLLALLALIKVVVPPLAFKLGLLRLRIRRDADPASAEPDPEDVSYRRRFEQFAKLGFRPLGTTYESCWFITPYDWLWHSRPVRWMTMPDGRTLASFHRITDEEPIRFGAVTILEGGGMVRTTCPGTGGRMPVPEDYHRVELHGVDPAELAARHQIEVAAFSKQRGRAVVEATLDRAADVEAALDQLILPRINHTGAIQLIKATFGAPALLTLLIRAFLAPGALTWTDVAIAIVIGAAICEATVRFIFRPAFRAAVIASHEVPPGPDPISTTDASRHVN